MKVYILCQAALVAISMLGVAEANAECKNRPDLPLMGIDDQPRVAWPTDTDVIMKGAGPLEHSIDPEWNVYDPGNGQRGTFHELRYRTQDGSIWKAQFHCTFESIQIECRLEHTPDAGGKSHDDKFMIYYGDDKHIYKANIDPVVKYPGPPQFCVELLK